MKRDEPAYKTWVISAEGRRHYLGMLRGPVHLAERLAMSRAAREPGARIEIDVCRTCGRPASPR